MDILNHVIFYTTICLALVGRAVQQSAPYDDYSWVQRMGIVGDSYTAGIGAGRPVSGGESCSRYSGSWATMLTPLFPDLSARNIFNFACSGAKTPDISQQIQQLPGNLDLAVLTAGGNDLCLVRDASAFHFASFSMLIRYNRVLFSSPAFSHPGQRIAAVKR